MFYAYTPGVILPALSVSVKPERFLAVSYTDRGVR